MNIDEIIAETLKAEGGYSNHVEDRGGGLIGVNNNLGQKK